MKNLLIVDDEQTICNALKYALDKEYKIFTANDFKEFENALKNIHIDIALVDLKFGKVNGLDIIKSIKSTYENAIIIMITAYGTIETSIQAIKNGAYDYILKPIDLSTLRELLRAAVKYQKLQEEIIIPEIKGYTNKIPMIGKSQGIKRVIEMIDKVKNLNVDILIEGESGAGKELVAREIHYGGIKRDKPFIVVNCAAIPQNLIESELFGYEKGAFTGADKSKKGAFELADGGSIFLDEIGEMNLYCQAKLLRAIQQKEILPLGSEKSRTVDVRVIAVTNRDLYKEVQSGRFREDLFYRLNVVMIKIPSLRERSEDIPLLVKEFIDRANKMYNLNIKGIRQDAMIDLKNRRYSGNIRELENTIYRACIMSTGELIEAHDIEQQYNEESDDTDNYISVKVGTKIDDAEKQIILKTLEYANGNKTKAAKLLGMSERSIYYKIKYYSE